MASTHGYPKWLIGCKDDITNSKEWNSFVSELHEAIQQQLTESHVQYFTDLSEPEKELFMQRATKALEGGTTSRNLFLKVSGLMDQRLNDQVSKQLLDDYPTDTRSDLVIEAAEDGAMSLLKRWPDMKNKLHICFNQPLQEPIRQLAWHLYLNDPRARKTYVDLLNGNPRAAISQHDVDISQKVEGMVLAEPTFSDLKGSVGAFYAMKATLSYHHAKLKTKQRLKDVEFFLVVPFVVVAQNSLSRREPASGKVVALLVEEYLTYLTTRPGFVIDSGSETHNEEMQGFISKVASILEKHYSQTAALVSKVFTPSREKIVATEKGSRAVLVDGLMELVRPLARTMLVGYLNFETLLYVWDQYIIGLDVPAFSAEWLSVVVATMLGLEHEKLKDCQTPGAMESVLNKESPRLTVQQFQYQVKRYHYRDLFALLTSDQKAAMPVLDPTQSVHPPWRHWYNDQIPPYTQPQDRRKAREEREAERERLLQQQKDAERKRREGELRDRKANEGEMMKTAAMERALLDKERIDLENELAEERRRRQDGERRAQDEIEQLKRELAALKRPAQRSPNPSVLSMGSYISRMLIPPPPTPASLVSALPPIPETAPSTPAPSVHPQQQAEEVVLDFLTRIRKSMDKIAGGEGEEASELDAETRKYIHNNVEDLKRAQMEVFGHRLQPGEFERMDAQQQKKNSDQMMALIQKWREDRRARELRQGR
ncbi:uncharacterized protein LOC101844992 [Aplysia californica]|uniref:Uncharacterized protein LOC101844992 n=1 Tax=Aplysia californica TaxID=6500 RepID=A0ABM0JM02_APLCA|nr:uncharacterized protein LOC101844992 [Aplysia californica]